MRFRKRLWTKKNKKRYHKTRNNRRRTRIGGHPNDEKAAELLSIASAYEKNITPILQLAANNLGVRLIADPKTKLKSKDSIVSKLNRKPGVLRDILRYTFIIQPKISDENDFGEMVRAIHIILNRYGIVSTTQSKNYFCPGNIYKGVNETFLYVSANYLFEIQFHTPLSFSTKMDMHKLYEQYRETSSNEEKCNLFKIMKDANEKIKVSYNNLTCQHEPVINPCNYEAQDKAQSNDTTAMGKEESTYTDYAPRAESKYADYAPRAESKYADYTSGAESKYADYTSGAESK